MKTIVAASDFSAASHSAAAYAASLAKAFNARLVLYNAYQQVLAPAFEAPVLVSAQELKEVADKLLQKELAAIDPFNQLGITIVSSEDGPVEGIIRMAREQEAGLIVTGMKGSGKTYRRFIGSTVTGLVRKSPIPVIVVPEGAGQGSINNIALAIDGDVSPAADPHILDILRELGERFSCRLYLIRITKNKFEEAFEVMHRPFKISRMVSSLDTVYEYIEGQDITSALNDFIRKYKVDIMALLPHKHSLLERWFGKSTTRSMVFETQVPLLILPDAQKP